MSRLADNVLSFWVGSQLIAAPRGRGVTLTGLRARAVVETGRDFTETEIRRELERTGCDVDPSGATRSTFASCWTQAAITAFAAVIDQARGSR
jgi:hypothetical protein